MEEYFCHKHGSKLLAGFKCSECELDHHMHTPDNVAIKIKNGIEYLNRRIFDEPRIKQTKTWQEEYKNSPLQPYCYMCHNCKYFMYHQLNWCYKCGQKFDDKSGKITAGELAEKYSDYKQGY